ncbi:MAG TPA: AMP-binding protein [Candidatus Eisenbacteria bacterium]
MDAVNTAARLAGRAAAHPDRLAIVEYRGGRVRRVTFGALAGRVAALAAGLARRGIAPGDRVLLFIPMSLDLYVALLAIHHAGAVAVFVDAWAGRKRLDDAVAAARPRAFLGTPKAHLLRLASPALRAIPIPIVAGGSLVSLARLERGGEARPPAEVAAGSPALITFTTGSTGRPKAAARSHEFLWAQHEVLRSHLGITESDVDMPTLPVFVLNNLAGGVTSVLPDFDPRRPADIDPAAIHAQMLAERVTTTSGSPAFYERLVDGCLPRKTLPVRALFTGGAPVLPALARKLQEAMPHGTPHVVYGSTEAEPIASITAGDMLAALERGGEGLPAGTPVPEIELRLICPHDGPVALGARGLAEWEAAPGETGEVVVSGRHVLSGYLDDPESDRENKIKDGSRVWHRTGDGARLDAHGRLWLMGRIGRRVTRGGRTWWGIAAEMRALRVSGVRHAAYLGLSDPEAGARAVLCVEADAPLSEPRCEEIAAALDPMPVDEIVTLPLIPRDSRHASKTDAGALLALLERRRAGGGKPHRGRSPATRDEPC